MHETPTPESQRIFTAGLFRDRVAFVTGGGSGIGLATAGELARLGARVAICGRTPEKLEAARGELAAIAGADDAVVALPCDIREPDQVAATVAAIGARLGPIDLLVNNAGGQFPSPAQHISANGFAAVVKNNLLGTWNVTREVANAAMIPRKRGCIVNVIANIYRGFPGMVHTGAARAGVENMTKSLAIEWAHHGIKVNAVAPGTIVSSGTAQYGDALLEQARKATPAKRLGTPDEVSRVVVFLASHLNDYVTGSTYYIDGGSSLWGDIWSIEDHAPKPS